MKYIRSLLFTCLVYLLVAKNFFAGDGIPTFSMYYFFKELLIWTGWILVFVFVVSLLLRFIFQKVKNCIPLINLVSILFGTYLFYLVLTNNVEESINLYLSFPLESYFTPIHIWFYSGIFFVLANLLFRKFFSEKVTI